MRAIRIRENAFGPDDSSLVDLLNNRAILLEGQVWGVFRRDFIAR